MSEKVKTENQVLNENEIVNTPDIPEKIVPNTPQMKNGNLQIYFCLMSAKDYGEGRLGRREVYNKRSEWIDGTFVLDYLGAGYVNGVDHSVHNGKAYMLKKTYIDLDEQFVVHVCAESLQGCDN